MPSFRKSSVMVTSNATVIAPSFATNQPSISCEVISTSVRSKVIIFPFTSTSKIPFCSISLMSSDVKLLTA